jgi:GDP-L-fucose synthase
MDLEKQRILVTGGTGFLGNRVVARLRGQGCRHLIVPRRADLDLMCQADIDRFLAQEQPEIVINLAAQVGGIGANRQRPGSFLFNNLIMGAQLIEGCRKAAVQKFVQIGTVCSYPKYTPVPFKETDLWNGYPEETNAPFGLAKKLLMVQLHAYRQEYGFRGVNLLLVNLYGPGDNFDPDTCNVIPALVRKCIEARHQGRRLLMVWGTGTPTRDFLYVEDAARAIVQASQRLESPSPVNVGSGQEISIAALARLIAHKTGFQGELRFDAGKPDGQPRRCLDVSRARHLLDFEATTTLEQGLDETIAWYLAGCQKSLQAA